MIEFFSKLFSGEFMPHGHCYRWLPSVLWTHVLSDSFIAISYVSISIALWVFMRKRDDLEFVWMFGLFSAFILACGLTHLFGVWNVWHGNYRLSGLFKMVCALVSVPTAVLLWPLIPKALALPSPARLEAEVSQRRLAQTELEAARRSLEDRVNARTEELVDVNRELRSEIEFRKGIEKRNAELAAIVDASDDGVIGLTLDGAVHSWNSGAEHLFGYSAEEIKGQLVTVLFGAEQAAEQAMILNKVASGRHVAPYETNCLHKNGTPLPLSLSVSPIVDPSGELMRLSLTARDISGLMTVRQGLEASLREKEVLLREVHHRVKNNMQIISSLLKLQRQQISDPSVQAMFEDSTNRVRAMALVHEKLYQSDSLAEVRLADYIKMLANELLRAYGKVEHPIDLNFELDNISLTVEKAIPCGLIVNELVTNALKHAFPDDNHTPSILIELRHDSESSVSLAVSDNGVGMPERIVTGQPSTLGLQLVQTLTEQLGGTWSSSQHGGARFTVTFECDHRCTV